MGRAEPGLGKRMAMAMLLLTVAGTTIAEKETMKDLGSITPDLTTPEVTEGAPAPGKRVRQVIKDYQGTDVHHLLYLPTDWEKGKKYPVIVEYAGNGAFSNRYGDVSTGRVEGSNLGYGVSGGKGVIWICMPYVSKDGKQNQRQWWGDVAATVAYCKRTVKQVCDDWGGDAASVFIAGFSRGSIACNYIGLHDDEIAGLWRGFICHSHYDGVRQWGYAADDRASAAKRLKRLGNRPQFICHERSIDATRDYLKEACPSGNFTFQPISFRNHSDAWVLRDIPERKALREWFMRLVEADR